MQTTDRSGEPGTLSSDDYVCFTRFIVVRLPFVGINLVLPGGVSGRINRVDEVAGDKNGITVQVFVPDKKTQGVWRIWNREMIELLDAGWKFDSFESFTNNKIDQGASERLMRRCEKIRDEPFSSK